MGREAPGVAADHRGGCPSLDALPPALVQKLRTKPHPVYSDGFKLAIVALHFGSLTSTATVR